MAVIKETLGRNIVFSYTPLQNPIFASRLRAIPVVLRVQSKCANQLSLSVCFECCDGVTFGVVDKGRKTEWVRNVKLNYDEELKVSAYFFPEDAHSPKAELAVVVVKYLDPSGNEITNDTFTVEVDVVRNPALVGSKDEAVFDGVEVLQ